MFDKRKLPEIDRKQNEEVIIQLWPHPFVFLKIFLMLFFLSLVPLAANIFLTQLVPQVWESEVLTVIVTVVAFSYYLIVLSLALSVWMDTYLDVWTITNRRIISREQRGLFNRVVSELELYRVQDVTVEQKGVLATMLNFGDLHVQTAGEEKRFVFKDVGEPIKVARLIQKLDEDAKRGYYNSTV
jgi:uncharacterized membrane protein YdbT with pleckstrin-like domain